MIIFSAFSFYEEADFFAFLCNLSDLKFYLYSRIRIADTKYLKNE